MHAARRVPKATGPPVLVRTAFAAIVALAATAQPALAAGARSFKSGPIQITGDGAFVWVVNPDHDSVSRIATATDAVSEFPLPPSGSPPQHHAPFALEQVLQGGGGHAQGA